VRAAVNLFVLWQRRPGDLGERPTRLDSPRFGRGLLPRGDARVAVSAADAVRRRRGHRVLGRGLLVPPGTLAGGAGVLPAPNSRRECLPFSRERAGRPQSRPRFLLLCARLVRGHVSLEPVLPGVGTFSLPLSRRTA